MDFGKQREKPVDRRPTVRLKTKLGIALWGTQPMPRLIEQVRLAERLGLESVWVIDSQLICRDVFVTLAACLAGTSRICLSP